MKRISLFLFLGILFAGPLTGQNIPDSVTRPLRGEEPRYPRDIIIGELGQGEAPAAAYRAARNILTAFLRNNRESALFTGFGPARLAEIFSGITPVSPEKFRAGGGRIMPDGSVSFLVRFIGKEKGIAGELYLRPEVPPKAEPAGENTAPPEGPWHFDDLLLDEAHDVQIRREIYPYDFTPYERFY